MVDPVDVDSRGIIRPTLAGERFRLERHQPGPDTGRFIDRYWLVTWDLPLSVRHRQQVLPHPVVNIGFEAERAVVYGVNPRMDDRTLEGRGRVLGVMFRPAGFRPFLGRPLSSITGAALPLRDVLGETGLEDLIRAGGTDEEIVARVEAYFGSRLPAERQPCEDLSPLIEQIAADPAVVRVDAAAQRLGVSVRGLQRLFADQVGIGPKWVIRRYRLYEAAERAARGTDVDWAALAVELGYSDQSHLIREFTAAIGMPPARYARECRISTAVPDSASELGTARDRLR
ncbi:MAG TPA: AraC family transcriptional regulator [Mycobacteriales bacterium]|nr:AraC family transcriptional regulator [Mycobacteriales bacterium]